MAYASENFKTKKALKEAVASGREIRVQSVGMFPAKQDGIEYLEGPWHPEPHKWYAQVTVKNGIIKTVK